MKMKGKTKKILLVAIISSYFATVSSAFAFVWPVINLQKISTTVKNINNMITEVTNVTAQAKTTVEKINAIGDVIGSIEKYANQIQKEIEKVKKQIMDVVNAITDAVETIVRGVEEIQAAITETVEAVIGLGEEAVATVDRLVNENATKEEVLAVVDAAETEAESLKEQGLKEIDTKGEDVAKTLDEAKQTLNEMVVAINEYDGINEEQKEEFSQRAEDIGARIDDLKNNLSDIINSAKEDYNEQFSMFVTEAFDEYTQAINHYYSGKITKDQLSKAGEKFKESLSSMDVQIDSDAISNLVAASQDIANDIENLENDIMNVISNDKEYSDEEAYNVILDKNIKLSFSYSFHREAMNAHIVESEDGRFLISKELDCKDSITEEADNAFPGKEINLTDFLECVNKAKAEEAYWVNYMGGANPYEEELYRGYSVDGVFTHISKDYSLANIANVSQTKQYATNWIESDKEGYKKLSEGIKKSSDSNRNAESQRKLVDLEIPRAWNFIRRVDALNRANSMVEYYTAAKSTNLYVHREDNEYAEVAKKTLGVVKITTPTTESSVDDELQLFSNVLLYHCNELDGNSFYGDDKQKIEDNISKCMFNFAVGMSTGLDVLKGEKPDDTLSNEKKVIWNTRANRAASDSALQTFAHAIEDNYNSIFVEKDLDEEGTFKSFVAQTGETSDLRDEYITGALINKFGIHQLLDIVDSEAQALQTDILMMLPKIDYSYFPSGEES